MKLKFDVQGNLSDKVYGNLYDLSGNYIEL
jgi:hypothetical protein